VITLFEALINDEDPLQILPPVDARTPGSAPGGEPKFAVAELLLPLALIAYIAMMSAARSQY